MKTGEIAEFLGCDLEGDSTIDITGVASLDGARAHEIAFLDREAEDIKSNAGCLIVPVSVAPRTSTPYIRAQEPKLAFALIAEKLVRRGELYSGAFSLQLSPSARVLTAAIGSFVSIGDNSSVDEGCELGNNVSIGRNVVVGKNTIVHSNCTIYDNVSIGEGCVIHSGAVIGADGFGYVRSGGGVHHKFPQVGTVAIEADVEIGANTCIDRGALGETRIGEGTKIDNLVQIAHNVQIGKRVIIAAQIGISGSTVIEDDCIIGGQVGMGDHARVMSGAVIGSQAGVLPGKIVRPGVWWGTPIQPLDEYKRQNARVKGLERLRDQVNELRKKLEGSGEG